MPKNIITINNNLFLFCKAPFEALRGGGWMGVEFPEKNHQPSLGCQKINQNEVQNANLREIWDLDRVPIFGC